MYNPSPVKEYAKQLNPHKLFDGIGTVRYVTPLPSFMTLPQSTNTMAITAVKVTTA